MKEVKRTERGWIGHYILADRCRFRRNTLLECDDIRIVVSTVGLLRNRDDTEFEKVSCSHYFETKVFHAKRGDDRFKDIDVTREIYPTSTRALSELDADDIANDMHEAVCEEISRGLRSGHTYKGGDD